MKDLLAVITRYREERGWTEDQLAEKSGLPQSAISSWYRKKRVPTLPPLEKICEAFAMTLTELLAEGEEAVVLTEDQRQLFLKKRKPKGRHDCLPFLFAYAHAPAMTCCWR